MTRIFLVILLIYFLNLVKSYENTNANNWFTKSMDYFHYENCSSQEKSDLTGKFYGCLNNKPTTDNKNDYNHYFKSYMNGYDLNPSIPDFINKYNPQSSMKKSFQNDKETVDLDSWPYRTCNELQEILRCMPTLEETKCLTKNEQNFFSTIKYFFQTQSGYICSNKERISEAFEKSTCKHIKNRQDIQQQCFSINAIRLSYDWKVNFEDGVMCDLLKNMKICEESYYSTCEEQIRSYARNSWILPLQVTPCKNSLFEPMIDALSNDRRRKRSVFNNQYGFKTADGNGNQYFRNLIPFNQETIDDNNQREDLASMITGVIDQMQKTSTSIKRKRRSIDFMGGFSPFNSYENDKKKNNKKDKSMDYIEYNSKINKNWANKFDFFGKNSDESKKKSDNDDDDDDNDDYFTNPIERNKKINFEFANKFSPFRMKRSTKINNKKVLSKPTSFLDYDLPGMDLDKDMNNKFNPNPFTSDKNGFLFGRKKRDIINIIDKIPADKLNTNPIQMNKEINDRLVDNFSKIHGRKKRSSDPYDESNPDDMYDDDLVSSEDIDEDDDKSSINKIQKDLSKKINKKFSDYFKKKYNLKTDENDADEDSNSQKDLQKFIEKRIKEQIKKEKELKIKNKKESNDEDDSNDSDDKLDEIQKNKVLALKSSKLTMKSESDKDDDDDDDDKKNFMEKLKKFIEDQIKKEMEKEQKKEKEKKKKHKLSEREKEELERIKEKEEYEKEHRKQKEEYEKEHKKQKEEYEKERKKQKEEYEKERRKQKEEYEKEKKKQKEEYEKEHGKKSTTESSTTIDSLSSTKLPLSTIDPQSTDNQTPSTTESLNLPTTIKNKETTSVSTTTEPNENQLINSTTELTDIDNEPKTTTSKSEQPTTNKISESSNNIDTPTTLRSDEI